MIGIKTVYRSAARNRKTHGICHKICNKKSEDGAIGIDDGFFIDYVFMLALLFF